VAAARLEGGTGEQPPARLALSTAPFSLAALAKLEFAAVDPARYPALALAYQALAAGQSACLALNAANEVAVAAFLAGEIAFTDIVHCVERVLERAQPAQAQSLEEVFAQDLSQRALARACLAQMGAR